MSKILSLVIPCCNEEQSIDHVLSKMKIVENELIADGLVDKVEVIVVNDGSCDRTAEVLKNYSDIKILQHDVPRGYGFSLKAGFAASSGEWIAFFDMDKTYDPSDLKPLLQIIQSRSCQMVYGSRIKRNTGMPFLRRIGNSLFTFCIQVLYLRRISDVCTGFRIFHRSLLKPILSLPQHNLNYSIAMTLMSLNNKIAFDEFSIRYFERGGKSKLNEFKDGFEFMATIFQYWWKNGST